VEPDYLDRLVELGILSPEGADRFSPGDVRRVLLARSLDDAGIPLEGVAAAIARGAISLAFLDARSYERFAALELETCGMLECFKSLLLAVQAPQGEPKVTPCIRSVAVYCNSVSQERLGTG